VITNALAPMWHFLWLVVPECDITYEVIDQPIVTDVGQGVELPGLVTIVP